MFRIDRLSNEAVFFYKEGNFNGVMKFIKACFINNVDGILQKS